MKIIALALGLMLLTGCSAFGAKEDIAVTPTLAATPVIKEDVVKVADPTETMTPTPIVVPRTTQSQVVGVIRELRANGCIIKKVANTDGIHYSQLVVTCGDPQPIPAVE